MDENEAFEYVKSTLKKEKITPFHLDELEVIKSIESCINCGLCINHCPVVSSVGLDKFSGPRSIAVELSRAPPEYWSSADTVYLCTGCGTCREVCPKNVNIPEIVNIVRANIFEHRRDLVPKGLMMVREIVEEHHRAFEPWEDPEEKIASRDMRLERLGLPFVPDVVKEKAEVLFYPGCQAEERAQEVREAAKVILDYFDVDYTLLDEFQCCSLPSHLMGDSKNARDLAAKLKKKVKKLGVKKVVTTCAGCTSNLADMSVRDEWGIPTYHLLEFLVNEIGFDRLEKALKKSTATTQVHVSVHDPCHLIRHTSRQVMDHALSILRLMPNVRVTESPLHDSCCGGGGMVSYHSSDVSNAVVQDNMKALEETGAERLVTPCPLCTAQIETNLYKSGSSIEVDDLTVFIAQRLPRKE
jgi:fumarate reductase (CoM/CoB) subunit B